MKQCSPSVANKLMGIKDKDPIQEVKEQIMDMIRHKADTEDLLKVKEAKTNKEDSVVVIETIEVFWRMLLHVN